MLALYLEGESPKRSRGSMRPMILRKMNSGKEFSGLTDKASCKSLFTAIKTWAEQHRKSVKLQFENKIDYTLQPFKKDIYDVFIREHQHSAVYLARSLTFTRSLTPRCLLVYALPPTLPLSPD